MKQFLYGVVAALVIMGFVLLNLPQFVVQELRFHGHLRISEQELSAFSSFEPSNVFRRDPQRIARAVEAHPWVLQARTLWDWPNHLTVVIDERVPVAVVSRDHVWYVLDSHGKVLPRPHTGSLPSLPVVTGLDLQDAEARRTAALVLRELPAMADAVISEWNSNDMMLITRDGIQVLIGEATDMQRKYQVLGILIEELAAEQEQAVRIDLGSPSAPVVTFR